MQVSPGEFARTTTIQITKGNETVEAIPEDNFGQLEPKSHKYMKALEESMLKNFDLWTEIYPHRSESPDPLTNARIDAQLKNIAKQMCKDFSGIIEFMKRVVKIDLTDHYIYMKDICQKLE